MSRSREMKENPDTEKDQRADSTGSETFKRKIAGEDPAKDDIEAQETGSATERAEDLRGIEQSARKLEETGEMLIARLETLRPGGEEKGPEQIETGADDYVDVLDDRTVIMSTIKNLESQVETTFELNDELETVLAKTRADLAMELAERVKFDDQIRLLKEENTVVDNLREDIAFAEDERNRFAEVLSTTRIQLEEATEKHSLLEEKFHTVEERSEKIEKEKVEFEAQVMNLQEKVVSIDHLYNEIEETTRIREILDQQVRDMTGRLENSDKERSRLKLEIGTTKDVVRNQREEIQRLRENYSVSSESLTELRVQIEEEIAANRDLKETRTVLESEVKLLSLKNEALMKDLTAARSVLRDIRNETTETTGRVRQRYLRQREKA